MEIWSDACFGLVLVGEDSNLDETEEFWSVETLTKAERAVGTRVMVGGDTDQGEATWAKRGSFSFGRWRHQPGSRYL